LQQKEGKLPVEICSLFKLFSYRTAGHPLLIKLTFLRLVLL
jgi:hypothetical protein